MTTSRHFGQLANTRGDRWLFAIPGRGGERVEHVSLVREHHPHQ